MLFMIKCLQFSSLIFIFGVHTTFVSERKYRCQKHVVVALSDCKNYNHYNLNGDGELRFVLVI